MAQVYQTVSRNNNFCGSRKHFQKELQLTGHYQSFRGWSSISAGTHRMEKLIAFIKYLNLIYYLSSSTVSRFDSSPPWEITLSAEISILSKTISLTPPGFGRD